ncbi:hypothetical protein D9M72_232440 [compost metagenome]
MLLARGVVDQAAHGLAQRVVVLRDAVGRELLRRGHVGALALFRRDDARRNAHRGRPGRHRLDDHRVGADLGAVAHDEAAQHLGARAHHHVLSQRRVALGALVERGAAQRHALVDGAAVADLGGFADHHAHGVVEEHALADLGGRVDLDARERARAVGDEAGRPLETVGPTGVRPAVQHHGMEAGVDRDHFPGATGGRVAFEDAPDVGAQSREHRCLCCRYIDRGRAV